MARPGRTRTERHTGFWAAAILGWITVMAVGSCGGGSEQTTRGGAACTELYGEACGRACDAETPCDTGLHCEAGACTAECTQGGGHCGEKEFCTLDGRCSPQGDVFFGGSDGGDSGLGRNGGEACIDVEVGFERLTPTVLFLIDQSSSMDEQFDNGNDRWTTVKNALLDPNDGIIATLEDEVRFGLMLYSSENGYEGGECPMLTKAPVDGSGTLQFALGNYEAIDAVFRPADMIDDTPTGESLMAAADALEAFDEPGKKVIILATDGEPDTCDDMDAHNEQTNERTAGIVEDIFDRGIETAVIGVGDDVGEDHLNAVANAGRGLAPDGGATYYRPSDQAGLADAFTEIISAAASCEFDLNGTVEPGSESSGTVVLDGETLEKDDPNGWRLVDSSRIELVGQSCDQVKLDADRLSIEFPCGTFTPIE